MLSSANSARHLNEADLIDELNRCPGLIPIEIDVERRHIHWMDLGQYHLYSGRYSKDLNLYHSLLPLDTKVAKAGEPLLITTDLNVLASDNVLIDPIYPSGFIFHVGRCGSTLLSRVLARSRVNLVWGEAQPHNLISLLLTDDYQQPLNKDSINLSIFRNLLLAMGRKRLATYQAYFIKFTTYSILDFDFIQCAFPDVPKIFIYRDPAAVLVSYIEGPASWLDIDSLLMHRFITGDQQNDCNKSDLLSYFSKSLSRFYKAAIATKADELRVLNYNQLTPKILPNILSFFQVKSTASELSMMQSQFQYYSKATLRLQKFASDDIIKQQKNTNEMQVYLKAELIQLYEQLEVRKDSLNLD